MTIVIMLVVLLVMVGLGIPIAYSLGISGSLYFLIFHPELLALIPERLFSGFNSPLLLALPLFTLMSLLMNEANLTSRLINLLMMFVGRVRGALGVVNVIVSMVFGGISGSSVSDTASVGSILIPEMKRKGYSPEFAVGVTVASSTMGMVIPPSIPMLIFCAISSQSVGKAFLGGMLPGILVGLFMCVITILLAKKQNVPLERVKLTKEITSKTLKDGVLALVMPVLVLGAILAGITTATEAAGIGALYALLVGIFIFKTLKPANIFKVFKATVKVSASVMVVIAFSNMFTWILTLEALPAKVVNLVTSLNLPAAGVMVAIMIIILIAGMFLDVAPVIMLMTPMFLPAVVAVGAHPIQLGVLLIVGTAVGLATPPVGMCLNVASSIANMRITHVFKSAIPFLVANLIVLLLVCLIPGISLWIPNLFQ